MNGKLVWCWGRDGTVLRVYRIYYTRFFKRPRMKQVALFFTSNFTDVQAVAEDFIERYEG